MYSKIVFKTSSEEQTEILIALLSEMGFDSFEEKISPLENPEYHHDKRTEKEQFKNGTNVLEAYILTETLKEISLDSLNDFMSPEISWSDPEPLEDINWNKKWESNFDPIDTGSVYVRAPFHEPLDDFSADEYYEIVINPNMTFGTGHHDTTQLMLNAMENYIPDARVNQTLLDYGTGTGILAIFAKQLEVPNITACDIDVWSIENAPKNFELNNVNGVDLIHGNIDQVEGTFDIIAANINRNVLLDNMQVIYDKLNFMGLLFISGFYTTDIEQIREKAESCKLSVKSHSQALGGSNGRNWTSMVLQRLM